MLLFHGALIRRCTLEAAGAGRYDGSTLRKNRRLVEVVVMRFGDLGAPEPIPMVLALVLVSGAGKLGYRRPDRSLTPSPSAGAALG